MSNVSQLPFLFLSLSQKWWVRLDFVSELLWSSGLEKRKKESLENTAMGNVVFTAFIPRMVLLLCTERDRHPLEEERGNLYLKTELYPRTESQHANTNVL